MTTIADDVFSRAEAFIWRNARLLERRRFAMSFKGGTSYAVVDALRPYRNDDGGFGNALEPDIRCPDSQPVPVQHALEILDESRFDAEMVGGACDFLQSASTDAGGVPFLLPTAHAYPRAPWWNAEQAASLNPTAAIAGLLHKNEFAHPWRDRATEFCWQALPTLNGGDSHTLMCVFTFLRFVPDRERADAAFERTANDLVASGPVAAVDAEGYVMKPLDWAPTPDHPLRACFRDDVIEANLDDLIGRQGEDGGWPIAWPAPGPGAEMEWRGWRTLEALRTLRAYGRI